MALRTKTSPLATLVVAAIVVVLGAMFALGAGPFASVGGSGDSGKSLKTHERINLSHYPKVVENSRLFYRQKSVGIIVFYDTGFGVPRELNVEMTYHGKKTTLDMNDGDIFDIDPHSVIHAWYTVMVYDGSPIHFTFSDVVVYPLNKDVYQGLICGLWINDNGVPDLEYVDYRSGEKRVSCSNPPRRRG